MRGLVRCVPDTNFLHHFRFFRDVDWRDLLAAKRVYVTFTAPVLAELDRHKNDRTSERRRSRSRSVIKALDELTSDTKVGEPVRFRPGCYVVLELDTPDPGSFGFNLDRTVSDDRILAHALRLSKENGYTVLLTDDLGMRLRARSLGLEVVTPTESLRLIDEPTSAEAELRKLKSARPNLSLAFWIDGKPTHEGLYQPTHSYDDNEVEQMVEARRKELLMHSRSRGSLKYRFPHEEDAVQAYVPFFRRYLQEVSQFIDRVSRTFLLPLAVTNEASIPAENVTAVVSLPDGYAFIPPGSAVQEPKPPALPSFVTSKRLRTPREIGTRWPQTAEAWEVLSGRQARFRLPLVVHNVPEILPDLAFSCESRQDRLDIAYEVHAQNTPTSTSGGLCVTVIWDHRTTN